jgi:hypothetical protein
MKKVPFLSLLALSLALPQSGARAQSDAPQGKENDKEKADLPKAEKVLEDYVAATGGKAAYEKHTSCKMKGTIKLPAQNIKGTLEIVAKAPDSMLLTINMTGIGEQRQGYDGKVAWESSPMTGLREVDGAEKADRVRAAAFNSEIKWRELYKEVKTIGSGTVDGKDCVIVEMTPAEGAAKKEYFDRTTKLLVCTEETTEGPQGTFTAKNYVSDWKEIDGVKIPMAMKTVVGPIVQEMKITEAKFGVEIDDKTFAKPAAEDDEKDDDMKPKKEGDDMKPKGKGDGK